MGDGQDEYGATIRERALTSIDELVRWTPKTGRNRLHSMIAARPDWVLSRQRAWGVPLTAFVKKGAKPDAEDFLLRDRAVNARIAEAFEAEGADAWYADGAKARFLGGDHDPEDYEQVFDILDVWFDSGSTHAFVLRDREDGAPDGIADLYLEGTDQHRGWFHSSLLQACGTKGRAPYRGVLTHGFTLDAKGNKMSKSLGNTILPEQIVKQYGADILRLWVAQSDYTADQRIGDEILKGTADSYRRLRNTMRFLLGNLAGFDRHERVDPASMPELERWVLHRLAELDEVVREGYAAYDFQPRVPGAVQLRHGGAVVVLFRRAQGRALLRPGRAAGPARGAHGARHPVPPADRRGWRRSWSSPWRRSGWSGSRATTARSTCRTSPRRRRPGATRRWPRSGREIRRVRRVVTAALEVQRRDKVIGASLEAAPVVHVADGNTRNALADVAFDDVCIISGITVTEDEAPADAFRLDEVPGVAVAFARAEGEKCERCWKILPDVGTHAHPGVCGRCNDALD